jgi:hypothetical protein
MAGAMKVGDYVTVDEIKSQSICRWIVLTDIKEGNYGSVEGGVIRFIENTKANAGNKAAELDLKGTETFLTCGALESLSVGGVFAE